MQTMSKTTDSICPYSSQHAHHFSFLTFLKQSLYVWFPMYFKISSTPYQSALGQYHPHEDGNTVMVTITTLFLPASVILAALLKSSYHLPILTYIPAARKDLPHVYQGSCGVSCLCAQSHTLDIRHKIHIMKIIRNKNLGIRNRDNLCAL